MAFKSWSILNGYNDKLSIDRIDVNGDYEPSNCRWCDEKVQANNRTNNHKIEYRGEIKTLSEWSDILGMKKITLLKRINNYGWSIEKAFKTPIRRKMIDI